MFKAKNPHNLKIRLMIIGEAIKDLVVWLFVSFMLPLIQLLMIKLATKPVTVDENVFNILFVTIASFLTSVFFVSDFWKKKRPLLRMMLVVSYALSFGLFITSFIQVIHEIKIFERTIYIWGVGVAFCLAVFVGFFSKYDENSMASRSIVENAKGIKSGSINGKEIKV